MKHADVKSSVLSRWRIEKQMVKPNGKRKLFISLVFFLLKIDFYTLYYDYGFPSDNCS